MELREKLESLSKVNFAIYCVVYSHIKEAVEDYLHYEDPNYSEDENYYYDKYGITILDTEKDVFRKIFGEWEE